jgi:non-specific serine/threonine protein kinase
VTQRKDLVHRFQGSKEPQVFLLSLKAGGRGLNLTQASYVIHLDPWWNPAVENQASDRAHRIGQTRTVTVLRLLMQHTVEEKMMMLKSRKERLFKALLEEGRDAGDVPLTRADFEFLIEG